MFGSVSSPDPAVRKRAIADTKKGLDFARTVKAAGYNLWTGQDGFDYPFQTDYRRQWDWFIESRPGALRLRAGPEHHPRAQAPRAAEPLPDRHRSDGAPRLQRDRPQERRPHHRRRPHPGRRAGTWPATWRWPSRSDRLFNVHVNDNYGTWDDDMIVGSVHLIEFLEMFWVLA